MAPSMTKALMMTVILAVVMKAATAFAPAALASRATKLSMYAYVPDGLTPEQWAAIKTKETSNKGNLGKVGTTKYQSRSFWAFHTALENGEAAHLFPVDTKKVKSGELRQADVPYMMRNGGAWDNTDLIEKNVAGAQKKEWNAIDRDYAAYRKSAYEFYNLFGTKVNMPWTGRQPYAPPPAVDVAQEQAMWGRAKAASAKPSSMGGAEASPQPKPNKHFIFF